MVVHERKGVLHEPSKDRRNGGIEEGRRITLQHAEEGDLDCVDDVYDNLVSRHQQIVEQGSRKRNCVIAIRKLWRIEKHSLNDRAHGTALVRSQFDQFGHKPLHDRHIVLGASKGDERQGLQKVVEDGLECEGLGQVGFQIEGRMR